MTQRIGRREFPSELISRIKSLKGNRQCCDCNQSNPEWVKNVKMSLNLD